MKKTLDITLEMSKLIKFSPKRFFVQNLKEELQPECPGTRVHCPTRRTVRAESLKSIVDSCSVLQELWEESEKLTKDSETTARVIGVASQMATFDFYFDVYIDKMIFKTFRQSEQNLREKDISAAEGQHVASLVTATLQTMRSNSSFTVQLGLGGTEIFCLRLLQLLPCLV